MESLKTSRDYRRVIEGGSREILTTITAFRLPNKEGKTRIGISVSGKIGKSVTRNKIKRRIREAVKRNTASLPEGEDIVIIARERAARYKYEGIEEDVLKVLKGAGQ